MAEIFQAYFQRRKMRGSSLTRQLRQAGLIGIVPLEALFGCHVSQLLLLRLTNRHVAVGGN